MQPAPVVDRTIQKVYDVPGMTKDRIYDKSRIWIAKNFRSSKAVIEYENKETGVIVGNGITNYPVSGFMSAVAHEGWQVRFNMKEDMKDNKIRVTYENLTLLLPASKYSGPAEVPVSSQSDIDALRSVLLSFSDQMVQYVRSSKDTDNW